MKSDEQSVPKCQPGFGLDYQCDVDNDQAQTSSYRLFKTFRGAISSMSSRFGFNRVLGKEKTTPQAADALDVETPLNSNEVCTVSSCCCAFFNFLLF